MDTDEYKHKALTERIIQAAFTVHNTLGSGFLEKVYENAMVIELGKAGLNVVQQAPLQVMYDDSVIGEYFARFNGGRENHTGIESRIAYPAGS